MLKCLTIALATVLWAAVANATVLAPVDLTDLTYSARVIARGRVVTVETRWVDDRRAVETLVTLAPDAYLKGSFGPSVRFRVPGGQLGRYRRIVVGAPRFAPGQHVIVFLGGQSPGLPYVIGLNQGVFRVQMARDGSVHVTPPPVLRSAAAGGGAAVTVTRGDAARRPMALAAFEREVRRLVRERR